MAEILDLIRINLLSPMVLAFALGIITVLARSDLRLPDQIYQAISIYLLLAIGLEGGFDLAKAPIDTFVGPALAAIGMGMCIPVAAYFALTRFGGLSSADAIAVGIHYGGVSSVTLSAGIAFLDDLGQSFEGFLPTLYVVMELPAFFVALLLVARFVASESSTPVKRQSWRDVAVVALTGKTFILLGGGVLIGLLSGEAGEARVEPFFFDLFDGVLMLFLLQMGTIVAERLDELRKVGLFVLFYAILAPTINALVGIALGMLFGLSTGGAFILGIIAASASFISAPAVVRANIPQANPGIHMTTALVITFPYNLIIGMPLYYEFALLLERVPG